MRLIISNILAALFSKKFYVKLTFSFRALIINFEYLLFSFYYYNNMYTNETKVLICIAILCSTIREGNS